MATAYAECKCATCGAEFTKIMYGTNRRDADSKAEWAAGYFDECDDCYKARKLREREAANTVAAQEAEAAGLPELVGSEKQVAWANTLRKKALDKARDEFTEILDAAREEDNPPESIAAAERTFERFIRLVCDAAPQASWWIDNRYSLDGLNELTEKFPSEWKAAENEDAAPTKADTESPEETALRKAAEEEMIAAPQDQTHGGVVEITVTDTAVTARYPKDDDFRDVVKRLGYAWDADRRIWCKSIGVTTGAAQERAAELGSNLLNAGFAVQIADQDTRTAAIDGRYQPEHRRWIMAYTGGDYKGWFCIHLPERGDGMYEKARAIKGSRYCKPNVAVPAKQWREALDFAELNDYRISPGAQKIIDAQQAAVITVTPAPVKAVVYRETNPADVLNSGAAAVLDDLLDE